MSKVPHFGSGETRIRTQVCPIASLSSSMHCGLALQRVGVFHLFCSSCFMSNQFRPSPLFPPQTTLRNTAFLCPYSPYPFSTSSQRNLFERQVRCMRIYQFIPSKDLHHNPWFVEYTADSLPRPEVSPWSSSCPPPQEHF